MQEIGVLFWVEIPGMTWVPEVLFKIWVGSFPLKPHRVGTYQQ